MLSSHQSPAPPQATPAEAERTVTGRGVTAAGVADGMRARDEPGLPVVTAAGADGPVG